MKTPRKHPLFRQLLVATTAALLNTTLLANTSRAQNQNPVGNFFDGDFVESGPSTPDVPSVVAPQPVAQPTAPVAPPVAQQPQLPTPSVTPDIGQNLADRTRRVMQQVDTIQGLTSSPTQPAADAQQDDRPAVPTPTPERKKIRVEDYLGSRLGETSRAPAEGRKYTAAEAQQINEQLRNETVMNRPIPSSAPTIELYVASGPPHHLDRVIDELISLYRARPVRLDTVRLIGVPLNVFAYLSSPASDPLLQTTMKLRRTGISIEPSPELPEQYRGSSSPLWVVTSAGNTYVLEGYDRITEFFAPDGSFTAPSLDLVRSTS